VTGVVATLGVLYLEDVGAEVCEHHRRVGTGEYSREVEDPYAFEREHDVRVQGHRLEKGAWGLASSCAPSLLL
jgi:hypothetical protein